MERTCKGVRECVRARSTLPVRTTKQRRQSAQQKQQQLISQSAVNRWARACRKILKGNLRRRTIWQEGQTACSLIWACESGMNPGEEKYARTISLFIVELW